MMWSTLCCSHWWNFSLEISQDLLYSCDLENLLKNCCKFHLNVIWTFARFYTENSPYIFFTAKKKQIFLFLISNIHEHFIKNISSIWFEFYWFFPFLMIFYWFLMMFKFVVVHENENCNSWWINLIQLRKNIFVDLNCNSFFSAHSLE